MALRPVHRIKHVIDAQGSLSDTPNVVVDIIATKDDPTLGSPTQVETGSKVNGIYLHVEVLHSSGAGLPNVYMMVRKNPGGIFGNASIDPKAVGISDDKRWVIHQEMLMGSGDAGNGLPRVLFNGVIKIPKGYIRNGPNDRMEVVMRTGQSPILFDFCLQAHYKEFR